MPGFNGGNKMKTDYEFQKWLKGAMTKLFGEIDLYTDTELWMLFQRCERAYKKDASFYDVTNMLLDHHQNYWTKRSK